MTIRPVHLVSCVGRKASVPCRARDLYQSDWFRKARSYVAVTGGRWFILSALYGVVRPGQIIEPYDASLADMSADDRRAWGVRVARELDGLIGKRTPVVILAGRLYREPIANWAGKRAIVPMEGLGIGQQKAWLVDEAARLRLARDQLDLFDWTPGERGVNLC